MSLTKQIAKAQEVFSACQSPVYFFDDDPDGLAAYLLLHQKKPGKGIPLKGKPLDAEMAQHANDADLVVVLDKHSVKDEFFSSIAAPCLWLDHHKIQHPPQSCTYVNPRREDKNIPTSGLAYLVVEDGEWIAVSGVVSDWELPFPLLRERCEQKYPGFLAKDITEAPVALYTSDAGKVARLFSLLLKGRSKHIKKAVKLIEQIKSPEELLKVTSEAGQELRSMLAPKEEEYDTLLSSVPAPENNVLVFTYSENTTSYTTDLSNELLAKYPEAVILIARESRGSYKCSLRGSQVRIDLILDQILATVNGSGGGHEHACGAVIPSDEFAHFVELLRAKVQE